MPPDAASIGVIAGERSAVCYALDGIDSLLRNGPETRAPGRAAGSRVRASAAGLAAIADDGL